MSHEYDVNRNRFERGRIYSQFFLPERYPNGGSGSSNLVTPGTNGIIERFNIRLDPLLSFHKIYLIIGSSDTTNLIGNIILYHNNTPIYKVPWFGVQAVANGRFSLLHANLSGVALGGDDLLQWDLTNTYYAPHKVFAVADEAKIEIETNVGGTNGTQLAFAIQSQAVAW